MDALTEALLQKETVEREEILRILGMEDDAIEVLPQAVAEHLREPQNADRNGSDSSDSDE